MLQTLFIKNIALITELSIDFSKGLNIITGETGAGKSIIIDSINLVLGDRAGKELIKTGEKKAKVEATFDISACKSLLFALEEAEIEVDDSTLIISRELSIRDDSATVKSVCRINGTVVSLAVLKEITCHIVDVHGQHEHQSLLEQPKHMGYLDEFAGEELSKQKLLLRDIYKKYHQLDAKMHTGFVSEQEREQRIDILSYQINEIELVSPEPEEEDQLRQEQKILENSEKILFALRAANELLSNGEAGAVTSTKSAVSQLYPISGLSDEYQELTNTVSEAYYSLEAAADAISSYADSFTFDAERLEEIEARLSSFAVLKRKYGSTIESVLEYLTSAKNELDTLINGEQLRQQQQKQLLQLEADYNREAAILSEQRKRAAETFSQQVTAQLSKLGLKKAVFTAQITKLEGKLPSSDGIDFVEFMLTTNPGEPQKPLRKVASGGEISRIMLALKSVLADCEDIGTMIFDEIDTGISGETATVVGLEMSRISSKKQVIAITHLPQIAAFAKAHYLVEKLQTDTATASNLRLLSENERINEVARIMGGAESDFAIKHAEELIAKAAKAIK